jgi:hypothetical protein
MVALDAALLFRLSCCGAASSLTRAAACTPKKILIYIYGVCDTQQSMSPLLPSGGVPSPLN